MTFLKVVLLIGTLQAVWSGLPDCFDPTNCDASAASCTIGLNCLGSPITMCSLGNGSSNGACQTFPNTSQTYCLCEDCVGLLNDIIFYTCTSSCGGTPAFTCPSGYVLHTCTSNLFPANIQYACCANGC